jgi:hypothetical protein
MIRSLAMVESYCGSVSSSRQPTRARRARRAARARRGRQGGEGAEHRRPVPSEQAGEGEGAEHGRPHRGADRRCAPLAGQARCRPRRSPQTEGGAQNRLGLHPAPRERYRADEGAGAEQSRQGADGEPRGSPRRHDLVEPAEETASRRQQERAHGDGDDRDRLAPHLGRRGDQRRRGQRCQGRGADDQIGREPRGVHAPRRRAEHERDERQRRRHRTVARGGAGGPDEGYGAAAQGDRQSEGIEGARLRRRLGFGPGHAGFGHSGDAFAGLEAQARPREQGEAVTRPERQRVARAEPPLPHDGPGFRHPKDAVGQHGDAMGLGERECALAMHRSTVGDPLG